MTEPSAAAHRREARREKCTRDKCTLPTIPLTCRPCRPKAGLGLVMMMIREGRGRWEGGGTWPVGIPLWKVEPRTFCIPPHKRSIIMIIMVTMMIRIRQKKMKGEKSLQLLKISSICCQTCRQFQSECTLGLLDVPVGKGKPKTKIAEI